MHLQSQASARSGAIKVARSQGIAAAYLNVATILFALILAIVVTGLVVGLYGPTYAIQNCIDRGKSCSVVNTQP